MPCGPTNGRSWTGVPDESPGTNRADLELPPLADRIAKIMGRIQVHGMTTTSLEPEQFDTQAADIDRTFKPQWFLLGGVP